MTTIKIINRETVTGGGESFDDYMKKLSTPRPVNRPRAQLVDSITIAQTICAVYWEPVEGTFLAVHHGGSWFRLHKANHSNLWSKHEKMVGKS